MTTTNCSLCEQPIASANKFVVQTGDQLYLKCNNRQCKPSDQWHDKCVSECMRHNSSITIKCRRCRSNTTIKKRPLFVSRAFRFSWVQYPSIGVLPFPAPFVINRVIDFVAIGIGVGILIVLYAIIPYADIEWTPQIKQAIYDVHIPLQTDIVKGRLTDRTNPNLAVATCAAAWILGWMTISFCINLIRMVGYIVCCRRQQQCGDFIVE